MNQARRNIKTTTKLTLNTTRLPNVLKSQTETIKAQQRWNQLKAHHISPHCGFAADVINPKHQSIIKQLTRVNCVPNVFTFYYGKSPRFRSHKWMWNFLKYEGRLGCDNGISILSCQTCYLRILAKSEYIMA